MALLVSREDQFPLFHRTYEGNKNDFTTFKESFQSLSSRLRAITKDITDVAIVFEKGNNSKVNFKQIDECGGRHYVADLVSSYFKDLFEEANKNFKIMKIAGEDVPIYRVKKNIWGQERTCVVTVSKQLKEDQLQGIHQHLEKKYKILDDLKKSIESPKPRKAFSQDELKERLTKIIRGQFINEILKDEFIVMDQSKTRFIYFIDNNAF